MTNYTSKSSFITHLLHLKEKYVFRSSKWIVDCTLNIDNDSNHLNHVIFSRPQVTVLIVEPNIVDNVHMQQPLSNFNKLLPLVSWSGLELKENIYVDS
jgi:hypothetical protein